MVKIRWKKTDDNIINTSNMILSILTGVIAGFLLNGIGITHPISCGAVAIVSTVTEHFLTLHPLKIFSKLRKKETANV